MSINNAPLREPFGTPGWDSWFTQVMSALLGWKKTYTATKTHDFGSINAQSQASTTVTVIGARVGDAVLARPTAAVNGIMIDGTVTASNTVTIRAVNYASGPVDPGEQVYTAIVFQQ